MSDKQSNYSSFEQIRHQSEQNQEYWSARELAKVLGYTTWRRFTSTIEKAEEACRNSQQNVADHFDHVVKMVTIGSGAKREIEDVHLTRYACYLIIQNADPSKEIVALGQTYFAVQTRRQELAEIAELTSEDYKRLGFRELLDVYTLRLAEQAAKAGVVGPEDFSIFQDHGFLGLYGGLTASDIHKLKELAEGQDIADYMDVEELANNIFRASHTRSKLERNKVTDKHTANMTHYEVGEATRKTIESFENTVPEKLPKPLLSIEELKERERKKKIAPPDDK